MSLLGGVSVKPSNVGQARELIGKRVIYLQDSDIDKSGRGYYFPRYGTVVAVTGREIAIDHQTNFVIDIGRLREMVLDEREIGSKA